MLQCLIKKTGIKYMYMALIKIQWKEAVSGWGIVSSVLFHFFLLFLDFSCFLLWAWVKSKKGRQRWAGR